MNKSWLYPANVPVGVERELEAYTPPQRAVLWRRGVASRQDAAAFFQGTGQRHDPFLLSGMDRAVERLTRARQADEPIAIYGDYDADGLTGTALLVSSLRALGARVSHFIPNRYREGYGLTVDALRALAAEGIRLVVTADCGARSVAEADAARADGLDLIITDHHAPAGRLPACAAFVNPLQPGDAYPFKDLSGAGLAYKLAHALAESRGEPEPLDLLDLVAIGTIADMVPLRGENRSLTRLGLERIRTAPRPGVRALMRVSGVQSSALRAASIGYGLGPRLNAAGRLDSAEAAYQLLMAEHDEQADRLAGELDRANRERRTATAALVELARGLDAKDAESPLLFAAHPDFREGLAGLVAARLLEERYRPVIIAHLGESEVRGSARSIPDFHITQALDECADLLIRHGGHAAAAGFTVERENLAALSDRLHSIARRVLAGRDPTPAIALDARLEPVDLTMRMVEFGEALEPCGTGNEAPVYAAHRLRVREARTVGAEGKHLKLLLAPEAGPGAWEAIGFGLGDWAAGLPGLLDVAFRLERNTWRGYESLQLNLMDLRPAQPGPA